MEIVLTHESALQFWRLYSETPFDGETALRQKERHRLPRGYRLSLSAAEAERFATIHQLSLPLHIGVVDPKQTRTLAHCRTHLLDPATSKEALFVTVSSGVLVASPLLVLLQMGRFLSDVQLELLAFEACGGFSTPAPPARQDYVERQPLLTLAACRRLLDPLEMTYGARKLEDALGQILEESASPRESKMAIVLCHPHHRGGLNQRDAVMNTRIDLPLEFKPLFTAGYFKPDLYWPQGKVGVEYDSSLHHSDPAKKLADERRAAALESLGISMFSVHAWELEDRDFMTELARKIAWKRGTRLRPQSGSFKAKQEELFKELFSWHG